MKNKPKGQKRNKHLFVIGIKYGVAVRIMERVVKDKTTREVYKKDLRHAGEELLDFICATDPQTLEEYINNINDWLSFEGEMTGYGATKYTAGEGENIFKKIAVERELYYRNNEQKN